MGNRKKKVAKLWEETVVLSIRDAQWQVMLSEWVTSFAKRVVEAASVESKSGGFLTVGDVKRISDNSMAPLRRAVPPGFVKLDGAAESATADVALASTKGLCFLVEVKSDRASLRSEWKNIAERINPLPSGAVRSKAAHGAVMKMVAEFNSNSNSSDLLIKSHQCHQAAYWEVKQKGETGARGSVFVEPYVQACLRAQLPQEVGAAHVMPCPKDFGYHFGTSASPKKDPARMKIIDMMKSSYHLSYRISNSQPESTPFTNDTFGLNYNDFQDYIKWLCNTCTEGTGGAQPINCLVLTTDGFLQAVTDTNQLSWLLRVGSEPAAIPGFV